ncbi:MAG: tRNA (N(6)-L-threonylcarbamoyladenosine(37)-C(2))-methylthiotransferase MtaB [Candidatus Omnitrophota bacterium]|jgi:threonylcarbamoyladenosine tRNA methylthiotransferase MtaB
MKTVKFYTLGCKVNQYETQEIREQFQRAGFQELEDSMPVQVCVINTCTVTQRADSSSLYFVRRARRDNPDARIIVTGCLAKLDTDKISAIPGLELIVKNEDKHKIISLLDNSAQISSGITHFKNHSRVFLKVQDGCNYKCSYCKVRLVRGKSRSRPLNEIINEAIDLIRNGYTEIVLSGICLGAYGKDLLPRLSLTRLIEELEGITANFRIRLSSIEVNDVSEDLLHKMSSSNKLCRHLHIPAQSGDAQILKKMNRAYSPDRYIQLIELIRRYLPEVAITTDVMVGFPGEAEDNFKNTVEMIKAIKPSGVHIFPYSRRLSTAAYDLGGFVSQLKIKSRIAVLQKICQDLRTAYYQRFISRVCQVVVERNASGCSNLWEGYTDNYIKVRIKSDLKLKNQIISVRLSRICKDFVLADMS